MPEHEAFVERIRKHLPSSPPAAFLFAHWSHQGRPTEEAIAIMAVPGADPKKVVEAVMDVDHYVGNVEHVVECRSIADPRFPPPDHVRFYQRINVPILGNIHHQLVLHRMPEAGGYQVVAWEVLRTETDGLPSKEAFRSDYNHGAWVVAPGILGYGLGSAPKREDVGFLKWKALTSGADVAASRVLKANIEGMGRWAARR